MIDGNRNSGSCAHCQWKPERSFRNGQGGCILVVNDGPKPRVRSVGASAKWRKKGESGPTYPGSLDINLYLCCSEFPSILRVEDSFSFHTQRAGVGAMAKIPTKVAERISVGIKRFQPILNAAKSRDVGESDTVTIIVDMLADIFGFDKYSEITSEHAIRGTYCDLATKIDGVLQMLIEVKAIGLDLKENHVKQAVDYAANQGVDWVVLTNGMHWRVYKVTFAKPISAEVVIDIDFSALSPKNAKDLETLYLFAKEGWSKSVLGEYHSQKQALSRYYIGGMVLTDAVIQVLRRELRRIFPDVRIESDEIKTVLTAEVLKREVLEGEKADEAKKRIAKSFTKQAKEKATRKQSDDAGDSVDAELDDSDTNESPEPLSDATE